MTRLRELRWAIVTLIGAAYCLIAPRLYYRKRK